MFRSIIFIFSFLISSFFINVVNAAITVEFIKTGDSIAMTGSNNDVRFDVRQTLIDYQIANPSINVAGAPSLDTTTPIPTFTWAFYGSGIGWIVFESGSNSTSLNCWGQYLTGLTVDCKLTGTGWNENIGDISFSGVIYDPDTWKLVWTGTSYAGDIDFTGIALPLKGVTINETSFVANDNSIMSVSGAWLYEWSGAANSWDFYYKQIIGSSRQVSGVHWVSSPIDFSLASEYVVEITDPSGNITKISGINVSPWEASLIYVAGIYAEAFCTTNPGYSDCPEDTPRKATHLDKQPSAGSIIANWTDNYNFTVKIRDKYGNRTGSGNTIDIHYDTTVKYIQTVNNYYYGTLPTTMDGEAFMTDNLSSGLGGTSDTPPETINNTIDFTYKISSLAPTNTFDNIIKLTSINYNSGASAPQNITPPDFLIFDPLFTATISAPSGIPAVIGTPYTFFTTVWGSDPIIIPTIVSTMFINDGMQSEWKNLISTPNFDCVEWQTTNISWDNLCTRWEGTAFKNRSSIATKSNSSFYLTGTYLGNIPNPDLEGTSIETYIYYQTGLINILYSGSTFNELALGNPTRPTQRMQIFGQINTFLGLIGWENRIDLINTIKKNTTLLSRNRTSYTDVDYLIHSGDIIIDEASFNNKRTIISVGGDIFISTGVTYRNHPLSIIALSDSSGHSWNIRIDGDVRDIHASLIAEHAITSETSSGQLYIHGLVSSANSPQEIAPTTCPYFVTSCTDPSYYDLPHSRIGMLSESDVTPFLSQSGSMFTPPVVVEIDTRLTRDPPKVILK